MKLWDTNVLSELTRRQPDPKVRRWAEGEAELAISAITIDELYFGLSWRPQQRIRTWLESFLERHCQVISVDEDIARLAGQLRGRFQGSGEVRSQADMLIAATARLRQLVLVTRNEKDFEACGVEILNPFL